MEHVNHKFGPGETVQAAIRKYNRRYMPDDIMDELKAEFKKANPGIVPRVGSTVAIPVYNFDVPRVTNNFNPTPLRPVAPVEQVTPVEPVVESEPEEVEQTFNVQLTEIIEVKETRPDTDNAMVDRMERRRLARLAAQGIFEEPKKPAATGTKGPVKKKPAKKVTKKKVAPKPEPVVEKVVEVQLGDVSKPIVVAEEEVVDAPIVETKKDTQGLSMHERRRNTALRNRRRRR